MNKNELNFILQEGEGLKLEFKESISNLDKELVSFANSEGGRIFLGVSDKGKVNGIQITNKLKSEIQDIANNCDPKIKIKIKLEEFRFEKNPILIIDVFEGDKKPYQCSSGFYLRQGPNSQKLKRDEIITFSIGEGKIKFDGQINSKFNFDKDFDKNKFKKYLKLIKIKPTLSIKEMLFNLGLCNEQFGYNNACILFFSKNPGELFLTSKAICATYQGNEKVKILDKKEFDNGIIENIKETVNYVKRHINTEYIIRKLEREEVLQYPEEAIREAIVNAIMHRDYFDNSGDVLIEIFRNKLVISNPGGLVKSLKPEFFGKVSRTRNPIIANLLARTEYVEKLGTGIDRIKNAMKKARLLAPVFEFNSSFFITLYDRTFAGKSSVKSSVKILNLIKENPQITIPEIAENIGLTTRAVDKNISNLKKQGILKRIGGKKGGYWKIKNVKDEYE